jgi:CheY-like chemotaxis protein
MPKPLVLVVEGEFALTRLLTRLLQREGLTVETCALAAEAMPRMARGGVDLVIADFELDDQNGALLLAAVHAQFPQIKRMLLSTGAAGPAISQALQQADVEALIRKPWDQAQFLNAVRGLLGR